MARRLGRGGYGEVWLGRARTGVYRAVKIIPKGAVSQIEFEGIRMFERFALDVLPEQASEERSEAATGPGFRNGHPNLINVLHVGETPTHFYYVMELADGYATAPTFCADDYVPRTLQTELKRRGHLPLGSAVTIVHQILVGLDHLHRRELLHRDVKPANVVFVQGRAKLADIGLLTREHHRSIEGNTPLYAPPEGVIDRSGDLYCLGKVLYEMVTGLSPKVFPELPPAVSGDRKAVFRRVMPILDRVCAPSPEDRFHSVDEFRHALAAITDRTDPPVAPTSARPHGTASRWVFGLVAATTAILVGVLMMSTASFRNPSDGQRPPNAVGTAGPALGRLRMLCKESQEAPIHFEVSPYTVPLRTGELIRIRAILRKPVYPLLAIISTDAGVQIVYPNDLQPQQRRRELAIPPEAEWWRLKPPPGTLAFVLLVSDDPIANLNAIRKRIASLGPVPSVDRDTLLRFVDGKMAPVSGPGERTRGVDLRHTVHSEPGLLERLREIEDEGLHVADAIVVRQVMRAGASGG